MQSTIQRCLTALAHSQIFTYNWDCLLVSPLREQNAKVNPLLMETVLYVLMGTKIPAWKKLKPSCAKGIGHWRHWGYETDSGISDPAGKIVPALSPKVTWRAFRLHYKEEAMCKLCCERHQLRSHIVVLPAREGIIRCCIAVPIHFTVHNDGW